MKKKILLACDIDGTLLFFDVIGGKRVYRFSQADAQAIQEFRKAGHYFALCTGRAPDSIFRVLSQFPSLQPDALIAASGAALYEISSHTPLQSSPAEIRTIPAENVEEFVSYFYNEGKYSVYWSTAQTTYSIIDRTPETKDTSGLNLISFENFQPVEALCMGVSPLSESVPETKALINMIDKRWGASLSCFRNKHYIDACPLGVNKGQGHARLADILGGGYTLCCVGDAHNDIPMFQAAGKGNSFLIEGGAEDIAPHVRQKVRSVAECIEHIRNLYEGGGNA